MSESISVFEGLSKNNIAESQLNANVKNFVKSVSTQSKDGDHFWKRAYQDLLKSVILYFVEYRPQTEWTDENLLEFIQSGKLQETLRETCDAKPGSRCVFWWRRFALVPEQTAKSIIETLVIDLRISMRLGESEKENATH